MSSPKQYSFLLELLQEAITLKPNESEETDRTTEEMEGRTAKTKVIIKRSQDSGSGSRKESGRLNKVVEHAESRTRGER